MKPQILSRYMETKGKRCYLIYIPDSRQIFLRKSISGSSIEWWEGTLYTLADDIPTLKFEQHEEISTGWLENAFKRAKENF